VCLKWRKNGGITEKPGDLRRFFSSNCRNHGDFEKIQKIFLRTAFGKSKFQLIEVPLTEIPFKSNLAIVEGAELISTFCPMTALILTPNKYLSKYFEYWRLNPKV
jgi:hypothetical protein